jgi:HoxN/HupN/NixA family high-affinity nickel-transporter
MTGFIVLLHVVGLGILFGFVAPAHYSLGGDHPTFTIGVGVLAYTFGLRHAFDADHIAAVDNTTRKLLSDNAEREALGQPNQRRPLSVGFWFSLGHSTIVFALAFLLALGVKALASPVESDSSTLHSVTGVIGASISGIFLWILGILNLVVLLGIIKVFREMRTGTYDEQALEDQLNKRGFMNRFLGGLTKSVRKPWHIYPIGVLFGLGFDTATEVGLLVLAGGAAAFNLPFYTILVLPILFAAGMCLMDTADGVFMNAAYGWAFAKRSARCSTTSPSRRSRWRSRSSSAPSSWSVCWRTRRTSPAAHSAGSPTLTSTTPGTPSLGCSSSRGLSPSRSGGSAGSSRDGPPTSPATDGALERLTTIDLAAAAPPGPPPGGRMISHTAAYGRLQTNASIRSRWPRRGESGTSLRCIRVDRAALDVLLSDWGAQIRAAQPEPDSQGAISWPSRDVDAGGVFRAHGRASVALDSLTETCRCSLDLTQASCLVWLWV